MISKKELYELKEKCQYKNREIQVLSSFIQPQTELMVPSLLIEGTPSSGKTYTLTNYLNILRDNYGIPYVVVDCDYCFTQREILRRIHKALMVHYRLTNTDMEDAITMCEGINLFPDCVKQMVEAFESLKHGELKPIIFVLDRIDQLPGYENPSELVRCFSKFHELAGAEMPATLTFISVVTRADFLDLGTLSVPTIKFSEYSVSEFKNILYIHYCDNFWALMDDMEIEDDEEREEIGDEDEEEEEEKGESNDKQVTPQGMDLEGRQSDTRASKEMDISNNTKNIFFRQFINLILDTYSSYVGLCVDVVIPILRRIWPIFIDPIIRTKKIIRGKNDVFSTFIKNKDLLSKEFAVVTRLDNSDSSLLDYKKNKISSVLNESEISKGHYDLSIRTKYLVIAAFLASYNEPKFDTVFFTKGNQYNSIVKQQKKKRVKTSDNGAGSLRRSMSAALPFKLERLLAILNSIWTENLGNFEMVDDVELMTEIATLSSLKTLVKLKTGDTIGGQTKWKCNVHWNVVKKFADDVGFEIENHLQE